MNRRGPKVTGSTGSARDSMGKVRRQWDDARDTLSAIRAGEVDALVVDAGRGDEVFTLSGADRPYRLIVEGMAEGTLTISETGTVLYVNSRLCEIVGIPSAKLVGSQAALLVLEESQAAFNDLVNGAAVPAGTVRLLLRTADRGAVSVRVSSGRFELDGHRTTCLVVTDISAEEQADAALTFQAQLLDAAGEAIIATDPSGMIRYANGAAEVLYGWAHDEMIGRSITETTVAEEMSQTAEEIMSQLGAGRMWCGEFIVRRRDGTRFWAQVTNTPVLAPDGSLTAIIGISSDVTERVEGDRVLRLQADISERIAADAPAPALLTAIGEMVAGGRTPDATVFFTFDHPDFVLDAVAAPPRHLEERTPILVEGRVVGAMVVRGGSGSRVRTPFDGLRASRAVHLAALVAQREISRARLSRQALHDPLTTLANRTLLADRLGQALAATDAPVTLLVAGVDHFKRINDGLGHNVGDRLLQCLAGRFADAIGPGDTVARFGADEFAILVDHPASDLSVARLAERLLAIAREPIIVDDQDLRVAVSIGIAVRKAIDDTPAGMMAAADAALDDAKRNGRNRMVISGVDSRRRIEERLALEQELRAGIPRGELLGYLQPVVNLDTGAVDGAEILVRWHHPTKGVLMPKDFVPWAEETDLVHGIGSAMLEAACAHLAALGPAAGLVLSVNAAARELVDLSYAERTLSTIRRHRLPERLFGIELTESVAIANIVAVQANLVALRSAGVTIHLDDFGTGYSSLGYLRQLPADVLKIDRSFVMAMTEDPKAAEVVAAVAALARALSLSTIAEGVETSAQAEALANLGIDRGQGFLYAEPLSIDDFIVWLAARRGSAGDPAGGAATGGDAVLTYPAFQTNSAIERTSGTTSVRAWRARGPNARPSRRSERRGSHRAADPGGGSAEVETVTAPGLRRSGGSPAASAPRGPAPGPCGPRPRPRTGGFRSRRARVRGRS